MSTLVIPCYIKTDWDLMSLLRLLDTVEKQSKPFKHVYVVDDASPMQYELNHEFIEHIKLKENGGPAKARNIAVDKALSLNEELIFFTDHDCVLDINWNKNLSNFLLNSDYGAAGGMTYSYGNTLLDYYHEVNGTLCGKWLLPNKKELWYMPSLNLAIKAHVIEQFGFDERFPTAAGEDVDLCLRLRSKYSIGFCPEAKLWHDFGYKSTLSGFKRFIQLFKKYKSSSATVYEGHTLLMWDSSEAIYKGNMYESDI